MGGLGLDADDDGLLVFRRPGGDPDDVVVDAQGVDRCTVPGLEFPGRPPLFPGMRGEIAVVADHVPVHLPDAHVIQSTGQFLQGGFRSGFVLGVRQAGVPAAHQDQVAGYAAVVAHRSGAVYPGAIAEFGSQLFHGRGGGDHLEDRGGQKGLVRVDLHQDLVVGGVHDADPPLRRAGAGTLQNLGDFFLDGLQPVRPGLGGKDGGEEDDRGKQETRSAKMACQAENLSFRFGGTKKLRLHIGAGTRPLLHRAHHSTATMIRSISPGRFHPPAVIFRTSDRSGQSSSSCRTERCSTGCSSRGAISASGSRTNLRSCRRGWGRTRSGSTMTRSP